MERRGRGQPQQRHSSLPASLHRLMVSGPSEPSDSPNREDAQEILSHGRDAVLPAPETEQQLPSFSLPRDVLEDVRGVGPSSSGRHSVSPILRRTGEASSVGAVPALPLPPIQPQRVLPTDPAFYATTRPSESGRGSPASSTADNYPVVVGSTAYSVTTLSPLRATILPPAVEPVPVPGAPAPESMPAGTPAEPSPMESVEEAAGGGSGERTPFDAVDEAVAVEAARGASGKRRRRGRTEPQAESTTSSSSEHATQAPKSKKTLIACHFCRARKLRCDGQKPSCANCRKRNHPCTYEQQPKRRGPGKTPRGSSRKRTKQQQHQHQQHESAAGGSADAARTTEVASGSTSAGTATASAPAPEAAGPSNAEAAPATSAQATASTSTSPRAGSVSASASAPASASASASTSATAQAGPSSIPQQTFEPILTGPVPTYPGFAYRPPSAASSSYSGSQHLSSHFHGLSVGRGMSRSVASDSVRSSNASNVSSAPSVPDSEEGGEGSVAAMDYVELEEYIDYPELDEFYRQPPSGPGRAEDGSQ
ncbi:hypothetical protein C8Q73DRAFT_746697 [Cubamyces lactineus]|nr:hypothetical protein C8Q73DRAFT_746697 [Cubamyces lactineus]